MRNDDYIHALTGSLFCGWLRSPSVLMCEEQDWDVTGQGTANRICGAGLRYNEQEKSFMFDFGGQMFTISKTLFRDCADSESNVNFLLITSCLLLSI